MAFDVEINEENICGHLWTGRYIWNLGVSNRTHNFVSPYIYLSCICQPLHSVQ